MFWGTKRAAPFDRSKAYDIKVILRGLQKIRYNFVNIATLNFDSTDNPVVGAEDKRSLYLSCVRG